MPSVPGFGNPAWRTAWEPLWVRLAPEAPGMGDRLGTPLGATGFEYVRLSVFCGW